MKDEIYKMAIGTVITAMIKKFESISEIWECSFEGCTCYICVKKHTIKIKPNDLTISIDDKFLCEAHQIDLFIDTLISKIQ